MRRTIWQAAQCQSCRCDALEIFASLAGATLRPSVRSRIPSPIPPAICQTIKQARRHFSIQLKTQSGLESDVLPNAAEATISKSDLPVSSSSIPWYLQVDVPIPPAPLNPLLARQILPTLPLDAPPILSPILSYLSDTAGLDNLLLLDLRHLDPPPALGANLIMLIGTARSVKHLNVSADRFCRWCRSNYKLRPYADGLLGRNELKLKLRRKARRQKLAQSVGNTLEQSRDDGITTGWVCVNVGPADEAVMEEAAADNAEQDGNSLEAEEEEQYENPEDGYIGFGSRSTAPRIVVQMFTEEKRLEMDLEGLWEVRTLRRANKDLRAEDEAERTDARRDIWQENRNAMRKGLGSRSTKDKFDTPELTCATSTS